MLEGRRGPRSNARYERLAARFPMMAKELRRKGVTLHFHRWRQSGEVGMHIDHKAGEKLFVDYAGDRLAIVDRDSGKHVGQLAGPGDRHARLGFRAAEVAALELHYAAYSEGLAHLVRYCELEKIDFSRSRANRRNDNCFTEQKHNAVVREHVGYL